MKTLFLMILSIQLLANTPQFLNIEKEYIEQNPIVTIALMPDFSPFSYIKEDKIVGFENDLLEMLSRKTGLKFQKEFGVWNKNLRNFRTKKVDLIASISYKKERNSFVNFTSAYYKIPIMIFIRDDFGKYEGIESLRGKKVGILKDVFYTKELQDLGTMELVIYETYEEITEALVFGKIDALIQNLPNINYLIKKNLYTNLVLADELQLPGILKEDLRFGVNVDKPILHSIIQKGLDSISSEQMQNLVDEWIDVKYNQLKENFVFTKEEQKFLDSKLIKYCIDPNYQPFEYMDASGKHQGLTKDFLDKIIQISGIRAELTKTKDWSQTVEFLKDKKCQMVLKAGKTSHLKSFLRFSDGYLEFPQVVAMQNNAKFVASMEDILDKRIGVLSDSSIGQLLQEKYQNFEPFPQKSIKDGLHLVASGELDGFIGFLPVISNGINSVAMGNLKIAGKIDEVVALSAAAHVDEPVLYSILQKSLQMIDENERKVILDKWLTVKFEYGTDYNLVWRIVGAGVFLLLLFGYWNHKIQQAKNIIEKQNKELEILAMTDKLTGVYNRSKLDEILKMEIDRAKRYGQNFGCAIVDIDYFKKVNDVFGHLVGDKVLVELSNLINSSIRKSDFFGRWGGEEFLIIAPSIDVENFVLLLNKIKEIVASYEIKDIGIKTISIGATIYKENDTDDAIIKRADIALYEAKNSGRNQVVIYL